MGGKGGGGEVILGFFVLVILFPIGIGLVLWELYKWAEKNPETVKEIVGGLIALIIGLLWLPELLIAGVVLFVCRDVLFVCFQQMWSEKTDRVMVLFWVVGVPVMLSGAMLFVIANAINANRLGSFTPYANVLMVIFIIVTILTYYGLYFNAPPRRGLIPDPDAVAHAQWPRMVATEEALLVDMRVWVANLITKIRLWGHELLKQ